MGGGREKAILLILIASWEAVPTTGEITKRSTKAEGKEVTSRDNS